MALPHGAMGLSAVCGVVFPDQTHLLFMELKNEVSIFFFQVSPFISRWNSDGVDTRKNIEYCNEY